MVTRSTSRGTPAAVLSIVVAGGLLSACGSGSGSASSSSPPSDPATVLAAAYQATSGAHTARVQIRTKIDADGGAGSSVNSASAADGVIDFTNGTRQLVTQLPTGGQTESRLVGGVLYTQVPAALAGQPGRKPWLKVTLPPGVSSSSQDDPTQALSYLRGASTSITRVGTEKVRDVSTTHYEADVDLAKLAAQATPSPVARQPNPSSVLRQLLGRDTLPIEIWVDDQQRVRQLQTSIPTQHFSGSATAVPSGGAVPAPSSAAPASTPSSGPSGVATSTEEFYDFGVAVDVQAPPADQVQDSPVVSVPASPPSPAPAPATTPAPAASSPTS